MAGESEFRPWDELIPDTLAFIFDRLSFEDNLTVVPLVCKSWNKTVTGSYCWQEIDIEEWSNGCYPEDVDRMMRMLIPRSSGTVRKISVSGLDSDAIFAFIAEHGGSLQTLCVPRSNITNSIVAQVASKLASLTCLDLSYCSKLGPLALEAIGKNCKQLTTLCRNMHLIPETGKLSQDDEALAISTTMPKLQRLEMAYNLVSTESIVEILVNCQNLEFLDLRGCWDVKLDESYLKETCPMLKILGPPIMDYYEMNDDECSDDFSDSDEYLPWELIVGGMVDSDDEIYGDGVELRFYERFEDNGAYGWPQSP